MAAAYWASRQNPEWRVMLLEKQANIAAWVERKGLGEYPVANQSEAGVGSGFGFAPGQGAGPLLAQWPGSSTVEWLSSLGVVVHETAGGIVLCREPATVGERLLRALNGNKVEIRLGYSVESVTRQPGGDFKLWSQDGLDSTGDRLIFATGGERNHGLKLAAGLGVETVDPHQAFVRLRLSNAKLGARMGPLRREVRVRCLKSSKVEEGEMELSSRGLDGPVISRLSASLGDLWNQLGYRLQLEVDWVPGISGSAILAELSSRAAQSSRTAVGTTPLFGFPERTWVALLGAARLDPETLWGRIKTKKLQALMNRLKADRLGTEGMGLPSGERACSGGVQLSGLKQGILASLAVPGIHFAGEVLAMHGLPGGNHQNLVWASAHVSGLASARDN